MSVGAGDGHKTGTDGVPQWVKHLDTAVWISDPRGDLSYLNERAARLLGREASECIGEPCHRVVCGVDDSGRLFCSQRCPIRRRAEAGDTIAPVRLRVARGKGSRWVRVLPIAISAADGSGAQVVHCVLDDDRPFRLEAYLTRVANRSGSADHAPVRVALTRRESEILRLLAEDETLYAIAARLGVSHATVRNHVQHILEKLGVHSIMEAVACYLLGTVV